MTKVRRTVGFLVVLACVFITGCKDEERERALAEAEASRRELVGVKTALIRANRELTDLKEELAAVKETRNELQAQVDQIIKEHGSVLAEAGNAQERIRQLTAQSNDQADNVSTLKAELARFKTLTETQQATIEELQKTIEQLQGTVGEEQEIMEEDPNNITP
jgi:chromosome segregation ATPase